MFGYRRRFFGNYNRCNYRISVGRTRYLRPVWPDVRRLLEKFLLEKSRWLPRESVTSCTGTYIPTRSAAVLALNMTNNVRLIVRRMKRFHGRGTAVYRRRGWTAVRDERGAVYRTRLATKLLRGKICGVHSRVCAPHCACRCTVAVLMSLLACRNCVRFSKPNGNSLRGPPSNGGPDTQTNRRLI